MEQTNGAAMKLKRGRISILFWRSSWRKWKKEDRSSHSPERRGHNNRIQRSTERCLCSLSLSLTLSLSPLYVCCLSLRSHAFTFNYFFVFFYLLHFILFFVPLLLLLLFSYACNFVTFVIVFCVLCSEIKE